MELERQQQSLDSPGYCEVVKSFPVKENLDESRFRQTYRHYTALNNWVWDRHS